MTTQVTPTLSRYTPERGEKRKWKYTAFDVLAKPLATGEVECAMMGTASALAVAELKSKEISWVGALQIDPA